MKITYKEERLTADEYIDFLKRTNLGMQYPKERFYERICKLVKNVSISLVAKKLNSKVTRDSGLVNWRQSAKKYGGYPYLDIMN